MVPALRPWRPTEVGHLRSACQTQGVIADAHLDLLLELGYRELRFGESGSFAADVAAAARGRRRRPPGLPGLRRARAPAGGHPARGARPGDLPPAGRAREPRPRAPGSIGCRPRRGRARRSDRADALARGGRAVRLRALAGGDVLGARDADGRPDLESAKPVRRRRRRRRWALAARPRARRRARRARA